MILNNFALDGKLIAIIFALIIYFMWRNDKINTGTAIYGLSASIILVILENRIEFDK